VRHRCAAACYMFGTMVLDLIDAGIFEEGEMISLYFISFFIVLPRSVCNGANSKVMREQIGQLQEQFWAITRTALNRYSMHGGGRKRVAGATASTESTVTGEDARKGKSWDEDAQLFEAFARWEGRNLFNLEVGAYRSARTGVGGKNTNLITCWLEEDKMDMEETPGVKRLDCEFVIPAFAMDKHRRANKSFDAFKEAYGMVEGVHFEFDASTATDTSPGDCVFFCTKAGKRARGERKLPKVMQYELSVSGAKLVEKTMVVASDEGFKKAVVKTVTTTKTRWIAANKQVKQRQSKPQEVEPSAPANKQMCQSLYYNKYGSPGIDLRPLISKMNAQAWKNELARLHATYPEVALPVETTGTAAAGWPACC
jgi:hypothetical protein